MSEKSMDRVSDIDGPQPEAKSPGLRERNKTEKLNRIKAAARTLFAEHGFDETTTRAIARRAQVGLGTLFLYATDKRDLLFLVFTDELEALTDEAFRQVPARRALIDELVAIFRHYYDYFGQQPTLSRYVLRELTFFVSGTQGQRFQNNRRRVIALLAEHLTTARSRDLIATRESTATLARVIFAVYQAEIREWLIEPEPDVEAGLKSLRRSLRVVCQGLVPSGKQGD